jgi:hypothetical protein
VQNLIPAAAYIIANAKGDIESKSIYQNNILKVQKTANKEDFYCLLPELKECLERYIGL